MYKRYLIPIYKQPSIDKRFEDIEQRKQARIRFREKLISNSEFLHSTVLNVSDSELYRLLNGIENDAELSYTQKIEISTLLGMKRLASRLTTSMWSVELLRILLPIEDINYQKSIGILLSHTKKYCPKKYQDEICFYVFRLKKLDYLLLAVNHKYDLNCKNNRNKIPLCFLSLARSFERLKTTFNLISQENIDELFLDSIDKKRNGFAIFLLDYISDEIKRRAIFSAARNGTQELFQELVRLKVSLDDTDELGKTPLILSIENRNLDVAKEILKGISLVDSRDIMKQDSLFYAVRENISELVEILIFEHGQNPLRKSILNQTCLDIIACDQVQDVIDDALVEILPHPEEDLPSLTRDEFHNIFSRLVQNQDFNNLNALLNSEYSLDINYIYGFGNKLIHLSAEYGNVNGVNLSIKTGSDVNDVNNNGDSALHIAAKNNCYSLVLILLQNKAEVDLRNKSGETPLQVTAYNSHNINISSLLIDEGADINSINDSRETILLTSIRNRNVRLIEKLLSLSVEVSNETTIDTNYLYQATINNILDDYIKLRQKNSIDDCSFDFYGLLYQLALSGNNSKFIEIYESYIYTDSKLDIQKSNSILNDKKVSYAEVAIRTNNHALINYFIQNNTLSINGFTMVNSPNFIDEVKIYSQKIINRYSPIMSLLGQANKSTLKLLKDCISFDLRQVIATIDELIEKEWKNNSNAINYLSDNTDDNYDAKECREIRELIDRGINPGYFLYQVYARYDYKLSNWQSSGSTKNKLIIFGIDPLEISIRNHNYEIFQELIALGYSPKKYHFFLSAISVIDSPGAVGCPTYKDSPEYIEKVNDLISSSHQIFDELRNIFKPINLDFARDITIGSMIFPDTLNSLRKLTIQTILCCRSDEVRTTLSDFLNYISFSKDIDYGFRLHKSDEKTLAKQICYDGINYGSRGRGKERVSSFYEYMREHNDSRSLSNIKHLLSKLGYVYGDDKDILKLLRRDY